jgi:anti-anti-sigma factor
VCESAVAAGAQSLILEVSQLRYVSSAGLRVVLSAGKAVQGKGGTLRLAGLGGMVREVFEISGFSGLFPQHESVDAAVAAAG